MTGLSPCILVIGGLSWCQPKIEIIYERRCIFIIKVCHPFKTSTVLYWGENTTPEFPIAEKLVWPPAVITIKSTMEHPHNYADIHLSSMSFNC